MASIKLTLLELVQKISEHLNGDYVSSIDDTEESNQIASIVRDTYYDLLIRRDIKARNNVVRFHALSDLTAPNYFQLKDDVAIIDSIKYLVEDKQVELKYLAPEDFLELVLNRDVTASNVERITDTGSGLVFNIYNDRAPSFWTSLDDEYIVCDSYDVSVDSTLQASKAYAYGIVFPDWEKKNTFVPDLAPQHFQVLLTQSKIAADAALRESVDPIMQRRADEQLVSIGKLNKRVKDLNNDTWMNRPFQGRKR